ncbi:hypothetical protein QJQ45_006325 [Haematococcus lacustris]|nr:hypothetical protein QJQ45_006325 [Haematococcus lacustris]
MAAAEAGNKALEEVAVDVMNFLARCGPRTQTQINTEAIVDRLLKWDKYFAYFNDHFKGIQETSPPEGLKPFASLWDIYKQDAKMKSQGDTDYVYLCEVRGRAECVTLAEFVLRTEPPTLPSPAPTPVPQSASAAVVQQPLAPTLAPQPAPTAVVQQPPAPTPAPQSAPAAVVQQPPAPTPAPQPAPAAGVQQPPAPTPAPQPAPTAGVQQPPAPTPAPQSASAAGVQKTPPLPSPASTPAVQTAPSAVVQQLSASTLIQQPAPAAGVQQHPAPTPVQQPASAAVVRQPLATPTTGVPGLKAPTTGLGTALPAGVQRSPAPSPVLRRAPAAGVQLSPAPSIPLLLTPAEGGQHQHHPPVQHHRQARRVQWPQVGTSTWATGTATGGQQHQHQQQDLGQVIEEEQQQPGGEGAAPSSSKRPRPAEDQALIQSLIQKVDNVQDTVNRLEESTGGTLLHGESSAVSQEYTGDVYQPHEPQQCRLAALAQGLTIFQLPQLAIDMAAVVAASILITRVYNHMVFSSVDANSKTKYGTGQRVQVVLAKSAKNSSGDLDTTLKLLSAKDNAAVYSTLSTEEKKEVDEAKKVLTQYLTLLQPVLKQLLGRPLNGLATIITDPTWQRCLNKEGEMDFPLVAYMGSHNLSQLAATHCRRTADGKKQVVDVEEMDALAMTMPHQLGIEVLVKAGQLALFRGNTVHAGNVGVAGSCCARLYGFGRPDTVVDNTTMNTSELGDSYHGLFQPIQGEGIGPKMADWNRRNMAGPWDPVVRCLDPVGVQQDPVCQDPMDPVGQDPVVWCQDPVVWCQDPVVWCQDPVVQDPVDPVGVRQDPVGPNPVVWCQDPVVPGPCGVVPGPCGVVPGPCGARTLTLWCQDPVVRCQDPVGQDPVVWCQDPVVWCQDPVVRCQDPVSQDPVVWCQDPVSQNPVVWLYMQESNVGRTCLFGELWIERDLHDLKSITTNGIPGAQLDAHIAMRVAGHNASKRLLDRAESKAQQDYKARLKDELLEDGQQALLLGAGSAECPLQNSPGAMMRGCMKAVQDLQKSDEATPWRPWHVKQVFGEVLNPREAKEAAKEDPRVAAPPYPVRYYQRADCNGTIVFSSVYKRPSTRNNTWVSIPFRLDDDKWAIWAGHVQFWVRLEHPKLPGVFLRLAVSRIYLTRPTSHPSCLAATAQAVPRPQQAAGAEAAAEPGARGEEPGGHRDADGAAGPSGIGGSQQHRSAKRGVEQAAAEAASTGGARKSQRLAASASQRQADPLPPVEDRPQRSAMGSMHQGYGDQHWHMFDATKIFTVFVTSFEDGEGYGRMFFVPAHSLSRS